ncbi:MAG: glycerophosphodiester phosphodiesterase [Pseudomonadaceae bacterium]|nr:glycerophosphodiester phosphodiesterase [Pseudomonadaceae bacterium]
MSEASRDAHRRKRRNRNWALIGVAFIFILGIRAVSSRPIEQTDYVTERVGPGAPYVIAHRGGAGLRPENTIAAFSHAHMLGVDVLEMDVRLSADGVPVVIHDETVDRTTDGAGAVASMTAAQLATLDAGHHFLDADGTATWRDKGAFIPSLEQVLARFPDARLNIELKDESQVLASAVCGLLRATQSESRVLIAAIDRGVMLRFRSDCPNVATSAFELEAAWFLLYHYLYLPGLYHTNAHAMQLPEEALGIDLWSERLVRSVAGHNMLLDIWTVNDPLEIARYVDLGATGIITDRPDIALALLAREPVPR